MAMRRADPRRRARRYWGRRLRRLGAGLLGVMLWVVYATAGWLGLVAIGLGALDVALVCFLVSLERSSHPSPPAADPQLRPVVVHWPPVTPAASIERHVAFAGALVEVAERYRAECERQAATEALAESRGLRTGGASR
jgi:hypothetical protein